MATAIFIHKLNESQLPKHIGSKKGYKANLKRSRVAGQEWLYNDHFHPNEPLFSKYIFDSAFGCQETYLWLSLMVWETMIPTSNARRIPPISLGFTSYQKWSISRWRVHAHERDHMPWVGVKVLQGSDWGVWQSLLERANCGRPCPIAANQQVKGVL
jgi:hypothetical protein